VVAADTTAIRNAEAADCRVSPVSLDSILLHRKSPPLQSWWWGWTLPADNAFWGQPPLAHRQVADLYRHSKPLLGSASDKKWPYNFMQL